MHRDKKDNIKQNERCYITAVNVKFYILCTCRYKKYQGHGFGSILHKNTRMSNKAHAKVWQTFFADGQTDSDYYRSLSGP